MRSRPGITEENAAKIQERMTQAQVETILGGPGQAERRSDWPEETMLCWETDCLVVYVWVKCDNVGRELVARSIAIPLRRGGVHQLREPGPLDMIRRWLKL
jgi:hypothetical protein